MTEVIENWLLNSVGCDINCCQEALGQLCFDGKLFTQLLVTYNICSSEYLKVINKAVSPKAALSNLKKLCVWFKLLGISITDQLLDKIANKNGSACLKLLYELYIRLEDRESLNFIDSKKKSRLLSQSTDKFQAVPCFEEEPILDTVDENQYLQDVLASMKGGMGSAEKANHKRLLLEGVKSRASLMKKQLLQDKTFCSVSAPQQFSELNVLASINEFEQILNAADSEENLNELSKCPQQSYIKLLRKKKHKIKEDKKIMLNADRNVIQDACKSILCKQEMELKNLLYMKIIKQSGKEKEITLRLKKIRMKYKKFVNNKNVTMSIAEKQEAINKIKSAFQDVNNKEAILFEKQRLKELHQRLYNERLRLKRLHNIEACRRILDDMVDYAMIKHDYYIANGLPMPKNKIIEWKYLFLKGKKLLPHDLIKKEENKLIDSPITLDNERIQELAESDFYLYLYHAGPWSFSKNGISDPDSELLNITGFIVHRLLDLKYNFDLCKGKPADLPDYDYKISLIQMNDTMAIEKLKHYLQKLKIALIDVFTPVNYFLNSYKKYAGIDTIKEIHKVSVPQKSSKFLLTVNHQPVLKKPNSTENGSHQLDKCIQVPSTEQLKQREIFLHAAQLGKHVYAALLQGTLLPDAFLCFLIIEYLKTLTNFSGWVIVNFPKNITQIAILEYMFTGLEVPFMPIITNNIRQLIDDQLKSVMKGFNLHKGSDFYRFEEIERREDEQEIPSKVFSLEELVKLKNSNLLPKPNKLSLPTVFKSIFSRVVIFQQEISSKKTLKESSKSTPTHLVVEEETEEESLVTLENFYDALHISSFFNFKNFDLKILKKLLEFILNDSSYGQNRFNKNMDKEFISEESAMSDKQKTLLRYFQGPEPYTRTQCGKWLTQNLIQNEDDFSEETLEKENIEDDIDTILFPGHQDWEYTELPISDTYANILATVWESIEYFYSHNLIECFGLLRKLDNRIMLYRNYIRKKADECLTIEDDRTKTVNNFQLWFNKVDDRFRPLDTMKNELHYRTLLLQCNLWKKTDLKKFYCDEILQLIKNQDWISEHLINLLRVYSFIFQAETDRFIDTMQFLVDYYTVGLLGHTREERLAKFILPKIGLENNDDHIDKTIKSNDSTNKKRQSQHFKHNFKEEGMNVTSQESGTFSDPYYELKSGLFYRDFVTEENPTILMLQILISRLMKCTFHIKDYCQSNAKEVMETFKKHVEVTKYHKENSKQNKKVTLNSDWLNNMNKDDPAENKKVAIDKVFLEWTVALENETKRLLCRIELLGKSANDEIVENQSVIEHTFINFGQDITSLYHHQMLNIDKVCDLLRAAIEEETKIQHLILLKNYTLDVDASVILYHSPPPPPPSLHEVSTAFKFTISQLSNFFFKLVYVAPFGIVEQSFVQILEDMSCFGHETGHCYLPSVWSSLSTDQITDIVHRLFGSRTIIDWRFFIICGLDIGFPSLKDILEMKKKFRALDVNLTETVTYEQYSYVFLWFEKIETWNINQDLYNAKAKELLFKIFQVSENLMNYTEFLLAFCKDFDQRKGFSKALALAESYATVAWKQDLFHETSQIEEENEKFNVAYSILTILVAGVFRVVDNVIITEIKVDNEASSIKTISTDLTSIEGSEKTTNSAIGKQKNSKDESNIFKNNEINSDPVYSEAFFENEESEIHLTKTQTAHILWKSDVYFSKVFSLLTLEIHHFALSADDISEPIEIEENLKNIFIVKGNGYSIKLFDLLGDSYIQKIFSSFHCYRAVNLSQLVTMVLNHKSH